VALKAGLNPALRLLCIPYAGGGAAAFRGWPAELPDQIDCRAVQLPGRGERMREPLWKSLPPIVESVTRDLLPFLDAPLALFGHSMGAIIAFELARMLRAAYGVNLAHLFVSGRPAPHLPYSRKPIYNLPDGEFVEAVHRMGGLPAEIRDEAELMQLIVPVLRADFSVSQTYAYVPGPPLDCPITAFGGVSDADVSREQLEAWRGHTARPFSLHMFEGGHFFIHTSSAAVCKILSRELANFL